MSARPADLDRIEDQALASVQFFIGFATATAIAALTHDTPVAGLVGSALFTGWRCVKWFRATP